MSQLKKRLKKDLRNLYWCLFGNTIKNPPKPEYFRSILFVCQGNICRSPFAEHMAKKIVMNTIPDVGKIYSAGLKVPQPAHPPGEASLAAKNFGINLEGHKSRSIDYDMVKSFDVIFAMEYWHFKTMRKTYPNYRDKIFLLSLFDPENLPIQKGYERYNIQDPYGMKIDEFHNCYKRIQRCIEAVLKR